MCRLEHSNEQMFSRLVKKLVKEGRQVRIDVYVKWKKMADEYADSWQSILNPRSRTVLDSLAAPAPVVQTASDAPPIPAHEVQAGSGSHDNAGAKYQFSAEHDSPSAVSEPNLILSVHHNFVTDV